MKTLNYVDVSYTRANRWRVQVIRGLECDLMFEHFGPFPVNEEDIIVDLSANHIAELDQLFGAIVNWNALS